MTAATVDQPCINAMRTLAMNAVQKANSGHPGTPMALAPVVHVVWDRYVRFNPAHPAWMNRDRSVGPHGQTIGISELGAAAPIRELLTAFGFTVDRIVAVAKSVAGGRG